MSTPLFYSDFDHLFDEAFNIRYGPWGVQSHASAQRQNTAGDGVVKAIVPRMDIHENTENNILTVTFELPGLTKENVQIDVHNGRLNISGESKISSEHEESGYAVRERRYGKFSRTLKLPLGVKEDQIKASMVDGVLTVTYPRATPETEPKKITIS